MPNILSTDTRGVSHIDCNPQKQKFIVFNQNSIKIIMGSETLYSVDLTNFFHSASSNGGTFKKRIYIPANGSYNLYGGNISQDQGEVSLIIIRIVRYDRSLSESEKVIFWEYLGNMFSIKDLVFLTGKTLDAIKHHGWNLEPYTGVTGPSYEPTYNASSAYVPSPEFIVNSPEITGTEVLNYEPPLNPGNTSQETVGYSQIPISHNLSNEYIPYLRNNISQTSPDFTNGGIIIRNTTIGEVELEILVMN